MRTTQMSLGLLLCATLTGCNPAYPDLRPDVATLNAQLRAAQEQTRSAQMQLEANRDLLAKNSQQMNYERGMMRGLANQLRKILRQIDSGFTPMPVDLIGGPNGDGNVSGNAQPDPAPPAPPSPPIGSTP